MLALRYVYVLALVIWLGGMVVLGALVAPTTFEVLQALEPAGGRALAGDVFGRTVARFHYLEYGAGALLLLTLAAMRLLGPRPAAFAARAGIAAAMLATALYSGLVVLPRMDALQQDAGRAVSQLPASDARRVRFDELHQRSTRLMLAAMAGALVLLYWEARER
ncbi:MAG: DUF4149 domain-containing protein [Acidobacteria bacterium]|nr:DUF4149 domain-containing protein [Acidobacteriota bacterium]